MNDKDLKIKVIADRRTVEIRHVLNGDLGEGIGLDFDLIQTITGLGYGVPATTDWNVDFGHVGPATKERLVAWLRCAADKIEKLKEPTAEIQIFI